MSGRGEILGLDRRRAALTFGLALLLAIGATTIIGRIARFEELVDALRHVSKPWFAICLAGLACSYTGYVLGYREVARMHGGPRLPLWTVARVVGLGFGANVLGSAAGGLALDFWALRRAGVSGHEAARRVLGFNTLEWTLLGAIATVAAVLALAGRGAGAPLAMTLSWIVVYPLCVVAAAFASSPRRAERLTNVEEPEPRPLGRDLGEWLRRLGVKVKKLLADAIGGVVVTRHLVTHPREHPAAVAGFAVYWLGHLLTLWAAVSAFTGNTHLAPATLVLAFATGYAAAMLPLPAGGSGGIEAALAFSLHAVGVPLAAALLGTLVYRFVTFWLPLLPALALVPALPALNDELRRVKRAA